MSGPEPSPTRWREALQAFERLQALDAAQRDRDLDALGANHPELAAMVLTLIRADNAAQSQEYLSQAAIAPIDITPGSTVGPYRLERTIGAGGMGEVWLGARADGRYQGKVAIKFLHAHLARSGVRERFLREGQILASLSHPNIARMLDAGDESGLLYLVLEYIEGERIDRWCEQRMLDVPARLRLFRQVCEAVSHAHAHLVVHRDLKPSNILVTADGTVKLLDFGIAKLIDEPNAPAAATELTHLVGRALTPEYAAPEQVKGEAITTATDVYALGVVLFALLTGHRPYGTTSSTPAQIETDVIQAEPRRLSLAAPADRRKALRGDLDAIVAKALRKEPAERYASVLALSDDLHRHLQHEPILAQSEPWTVRVRKYVRRHRLGVAAAAAIAVAIVAGIGATLWQAQLARASAQRATATKDFLISVFRASDPRIASDVPRGAITAKELLDVGAARIEKEFAGQPELQIELLGLTADIYESGLADEERYAALQKRRIELARAHYGPAHPIVLEGLLSDVRAAGYRLDYAKADQLLSEIDALLRTSGQDRSLLRAKWWWSKAELIHASGGPFDDRIRAVHESLALYKELAPHSNDYGYVLGLAALSYSSLDDDVQARRFSEQALAVIEAAPDRDDAAIPVLLTDHGGFLESVGDFAAAKNAYERAEELARKTVGERHGTYWEARANHARLLHQRGERERAHVLFDQMLPTIPPDWTTGTHDAWVRGVYADCLVAEGRAAEAIPLLEAGMRKSAERPFGREGLIWSAKLADAYDSAGRTAEARGLLEASIEGILANVRPTAKLALAARERRGRFLLDHSKPGDADFAAAEAEFLAVLEQAADRPWLETALAHAGLARIATARGDHAKALDESQAALAALARVQELYDVRFQPQLWLVRSAAMRTAGDAAGALQWAERALEASTRYDHPGSPAIVAARAAVRSASGLVDRP